MSYLLTTAVGPSPSGCTGTQRRRERVEPHRERPGDPAGDPDFRRLCARRNDSEALNRLLEDSLYIGRAHSLGRSRQLVDLLGWALLVNSLTLARHRPALRLTA